MELYRIGKSTCYFRDKPVILSVASVAGPEEGKGPLGHLFDLVYRDTLCGEASWERAESRMLRQALDLCLAKASEDPSQVDFLLAGDLLNQIISSSYMARDFDIPFLGLYGACSTIAEGLCIGSMIVAGGFARLVAVTSSSHHDTAERQYRYPTEFGYQRAPTNQWTVTLAGAALLSATGKGPAVEAITVGRVLDYGISDANDMGSAMAPAFADTVFRHLADMSRKPHDYDIIVSGDLGAVGSMVARHMLSDKGVDLGNIYYDAGLMIYDSKSDLKAGASGCGCAAGILSVKLWPGLNSGKYKRVLLVATGALHSPTSTQQGESIPCIAHAVSLVCRD